MGAGLIIIKHVHARHTQGLSAQLEREGEGEEREGREGGGGGGRGRGRVWSL